MGKCECSTEQALMYTGAAAAGAYVVAQVAAPKQYEKFMWGKLQLETPPNCAGQKAAQWHSYCLACIGGFQAVGAYEKPSSRKLAMTGAMWGGAAVLTGVHGFKDKAMKPEVAAAAMIGQAGLGAAMLSRAAWMRKNETDKL